MVRAHTTDLQCPVLCQLCPGRQPPAGWEIPRERMATVGLIPFHLQEVRENTFELSEEKSFPSHTHIKRNTYHPLVLHV